MARDSNAYQGLHARLCLFVEIYIFFEWVVPASKQSHSVPVIYIYTVGNCHGCSSKAYTFHKQFLLLIDLFNNLHIHSIHPINYT